MQNETIELVHSNPTETHQLARRVPKDTPRYHFFLYKHSHDGDDLESVGTHLSQHNQCYCRPPLDRRQKEDHYCFSATTILVSFYVQIFMRTEAFGSLATGSHLYCQPFQDNFTHAEICGDGRVCGRAATELIQNESKPASKLCFSSHNSEKEPKVSIHPV